MASFNKVVMVGNLCRDPELRYTPQGRAVCKASLAMNHSWKTEAGEKKEEVTFVDCTFWGKTAENLAQYKKKGESILVEGRLRLETWDDKQTGQKRSKLGVVGETVQFLGGRPQGGQEQEDQGQQGQEPSKTTREWRQPAPAESGGHGPDPDDDVPF